MSLSEERAWTPQQRALIVGAIVAGVVALLGLFFGYQYLQRGKLPKGVEKIEELGFGFRRLTIAKSNGFETGHYPFLFYHNQLLGQIGPPPSISPSGEYAVYQDVRNGKLFLFRRRDERTTTLAQAGLGPVTRYIWHEDQGNVEAVIGQEGYSAVYQLQ